MTNWKEMPAWQHLQKYRPLLYELVVRDLKTKEKSVEGWAFYALLTVAVAAAFLGILLRNVSYTVS